MCRFPIAGRQIKTISLDLRFYQVIKYSNIKTSTYLQDSFLHIEFVKHLYLRRKATL